MTEDGKLRQMKPMRGNAWVFRGVLDVDWEICAYRTYQELQTKGMYTAEEIGKYCMVKVDPDFPKKVRKGDFIVGEFMGFGMITIMPVCLSSGRAWPPCFATRRLPTFSEIR
jgi:hypothetical protein